MCFNTLYITYDKIYLKILSIYKLVLASVCNLCIRCHTIVSYLNIIYMTHTVLLLHYQESV